MKTLLSRRQSCSGQIMVEACIGLALMAFAWIIISYSLFMANNNLRTAMAARYAAWHKGAGGSDLTVAQLDQYFFYQPGISKVEYGQGDGIGSLAVGDKAPSFNDGGGWPTKAKVTFGVTDINDSSNPFPFSLLKTRVPFMPNSDMTGVLSVNSTCQWDQDSDTWTSPGAALSGLWNMLKGIVSSFF